MKTVLITGSSGLIGSECVRHFDHLGWHVHGLDGNQRAEFFGSDGDTTATQNRLAEECSYEYHKADLRDRFGIRNWLYLIMPDMVIHCAAQPSHDFATEYPMIDWEVNANGTANLLDATRRNRPDDRWNSADGRQCQQPDHQRRRRGEGRERFSSESHRRTRVDDR